MKTRVIKIILCFIIIIICCISGYFLIKLNEPLVNPNEVTTDKNYVDVIYENNSEINQVEDQEIIGILTIEKIGLRAFIKDGSTNEILKEYIGHIEDTSIYDGNVAIAAHNRGNQYSYFARLNELEIGDKVIYETRYFTRTYIVESKTTIKETDWTLLEASNENKLTMITCIKNHSSQRLCVQAVEVK